MIELKKTPLIITFSFSVLMSQPANDVYYVRYFESDHNFKADLSMLSTDRRGRSHLAVSYNEKDPFKSESFVGIVDQHYFHNSIFLKNT